MAFGGDWGLNNEGQSCTAARLSSGSGPCRPDADNVAFRGASCALPPTPGPRSAGRAVLWLGPLGRHPTVTGFLSTPFTRPSILQGHPPPGVLRGSPRSRPRGSIGWLATRGRSARASAPSPAPATQDAASAKRPRGSGPRPDSAPGQLGRRRRTWPFRSRLPRHSRVGGGKKSEPCFPGPRCSAPNPTPAPPPSPNTPSGARLTLGLPRGRKGGRALGWGKVGVAATLRLTTTSVSAG